MKRIGLIIFVLVLFASCRNDEKDTKSICELNDPVEELAWLKEMKNSLTDCTCEMSILQATYKDQTVFYVAMTDPLCDGFLEINLLDCNGKSVEIISSDEYQAYLGKVTNVKNLYRCKTPE